MFETQEITILLTEDDPGHARLIEKNLRRSNITNKIVHAAMANRPLIIYSVTSAPRRYWYYWT